MGKGAQEIIPGSHDPEKKHRPTMLTTDLALCFDPTYEKISRHFLEHPVEFALPSGPPGRSCCTVWRSVHSVNGTQWTLRIARRCLVRCCQESAEEFIRNPTSWAATRNPPSPARRNDRPRSALEDEVELGPASQGDLI